jgi:hypothetical protein
MLPYISGATDRYKKFWEELIRVFDLTLFNDPAINLNNLFKNLLRGDSQTEIRQEVKLFSKIYNFEHNYRILHRVVQRLSQHNLKIAPPPYSKTLTKKITIHTYPSLHDLLPNQIAFL